MIVVPAYPNDLPYLFIALFVPAQIGKVALNLGLGGPPKVVMVAQKPDDVPLIEVIFQGFKVVFVVHQELLEALMRIRHEDQLLHLRIGEPKRGILVQGC
jgi:hypothetical protein